MRNLVLCGFMGTGKTTIGKALASISSLPFIDIDEEIEKRTGMKIADIFSQMGELFFRDIEEEMIMVYSREGGRIIAIGGGALQRETNLLALKEKGFLLCLLSTPRVILRRLKDDETRPLLKGDGNKLQRIEALLRKRFPNYLKADAFLETSYMSIGSSVKYAGRLLEYLKDEVILSDQKPEDRWVKSAFENEEELKSLLRDDNLSVSFTAAVRLWKNNFPLDWEMFRGKKNIFFKWLMEEVSQSERNTPR